MSNKLISDDEMGRERIVPDDEMGVGTGMTRSALQGMTFGFSDEIGAGVAALPASLQTGEPYGDVYRSMMDQLKQDRTGFRGQHPVLSTGSEIAGGITTGLTGAAKIGSTRLGQYLGSNLPRWAQAAGIGGVEGAIYGAGSADPGERGQGATVGGTTGAALGPTVGWGLEKLGKFGVGFTRWARNKLASTPKTEAVRALRSALVEEGLEADDAVRLYESLGAEGLPADIGENFRAVTRAAVDIPGGAKATASQTLRNRQLGQGSRLLDAAETAIGSRARELPMTVSQIAERRAAEAGPIYKLAYSQGIQMTDDLAPIVQRDPMKAALRQAKRIASGYGDEFSTGSLKHLHYAKMALYDQARAAQRAGKTTLANSIDSTRNDLLKAIGKQNKTYLRANEIYSNDSALLDAAIEGRKFLKMSAFEMNDLLSGMEQPERELFRMGSLASIQDMLDNTQMTTDATRKLVNTTGMLKKLSMLFGDADKAKQFMDKAMAEQAFVRTRNVVAGGSPTSQNLAGQQFLRDAVQPEGVLDFMVDPVGAGLRTAKELLSKKQLSSETLQELSRMLLDKGMTPEQLQKVLASPRFTMGLQQMGGRAPMAIRTAVPPAAIALQDE